MQNVRNAAVAGQFYPADARQLGADVDSLLLRARTDAPCPKVLVAPHAGYMYSGAIAAEVYARLANARQPVSRVVLLGPSHRVGFHGIAASSADSFRTPLGDVPVDRAALQSISGLPGVHQRDEAHALEHSLEVHLPFLQRCLDRFGLVPLVVGDAPPEQVAAVIDALWGGPETLIVVSSDLSHFLPYDQARQQDHATRQLIESRRPVLTGKQACGCRPLNGLLTVLERRELAIETVAVKNSGDTAGNRDRVVGYGAWVVNEAATREVAGGDGRESKLNLAQRQQLLHLARSAITARLNGEANVDIDAGQYDRALRARRGSFVTVNLEGRLRGCIGNLQATRPLLLDVFHNAGAAAFQDPRFKPLSQSEFPSIELHISVLSEPRPAPAGSREELLAFLEPGIHGLILQQGSRRATYLPSVWDKLPEPDRFVEELRAKAGLPREGWSDDLQASVYTTDEFS